MLCFLHHVAITVGPTQQESPVCIIQDSVVKRHCHKVKKAADSMTALPQLEATSTFAARVSCSEEQTAPASVRGRPP